MSPRIVFPVTIIALCACAWTGAALQNRLALRGGQVHDDLAMVLASTLTLLALIIGFTFSMATTRYDMRKNYEEAEANAIGTEYLRAELLPEAASTRTKTLLRDYVAQRILFYRTDAPRSLDEIGARTAELQTQLWEAVRGQATVSPTPVTALAVAGMNDVINSQGYTQAAWWNRIPQEAWALMGLIAILCNLMLGFMTGSHKSRVFLGILPLVTAIAFFLIADIDSPRHGLIHIVPQNLLALAATLR